MTGQRRSRFFEKTEIPVNYEEFFSLPGEVVKYSVVKRYKIVPAIS
jgi:hypothetical protein